MSAIISEGLQSSLTDSSTEEAITTLVEIVREQQEQIDELQEQLSQTKREQAEDRQRITTLEDTIDDIETAEDAEDGDISTTTPTPEMVDTTVPNAETSLEDVIRLPEHVAEDSLSKNQERARFVAKDVVDYSRSVPAGRVIRSSEIRRVLRAGEDSTIHTETVSRVMDFLDRLGEDDVRIRESQSGERVVVFEDDLVKRIVAWGNHDVVTPNTSSGGART